MLIGIILLPACWGVSLAVYQLYQISNESTWAVGHEVWALPAGFLIWVLIFFLLPRPVRTYVLGHELTHAMWALMMGARIGKLKVGKSGGHVELSKTNFVITLAPYFFPFYTFLVIAAYYLSAIWVDMAPCRIWWLGALGATWSFHITFTIDMLSQRQPDIQEHGRIFSYTIICMMNVLLIGAWMVFVGSPKFADLGNLLARENTSAYQCAYAQLVAGWTWIRAWVENRT